MVGGEVSIRQGGFMARDGRPAKISKGLWLQALLNPGVQADIYHTLTLKV